LVIFPKHVIVLVTARIRSAVWNYNWLPSWHCDCQHCCNKYL